MPLTPPPGQSARRTTAPHAVIHPGGDTATAISGEPCPPARTGPPSTDAHLADIPIQSRTEAELLAENYALRSMLVALRAIEQAKGTVMLTYGVTAGAAVDLLQRFAERHNIGVRDLATRLTRELPGQNPHPTSKDTMERLLTDLASHQPDSSGSDDRAAMNSWSRLWGPPAGSCGHDD